MCFAERPQMSSRFGSVRQRAREAATAARSGQLLSAASATVAVAAATTSAAVAATSAVAASVAGTEDWVNGPASTGLDPDEDKFMMTIEEEMMAEMAAARLREAELRHATRKLPTQPASAGGAASREPRTPEGPLSADDAVRRKQAQLRSRISQLEKQAQQSGTPPGSTAVPLSNLPPGTLPQGSAASSRAGSSMAGSDTPNDAVRRHHTPQRAAPSVKEVDGPVPHPHAWLPIHEPSRRPRPPSP